MTFTNIAESGINRRKLRRQRAYDRFYINPARLRDDGYMDRKEKELRSLEKSLSKQVSAVSLFVAGLC